MSNELGAKKVGGASAADLAYEGAAPAVPGKTTLTGGLPGEAAADERNDPAKRPPPYVAMDQAIVDLMWRSKDEFFKSKDPFWDCVDKELGAKHLHTLAQVIPGARALGVLPSIEKLIDVHNYGSSWGINFKGPSLLAIATNGRWGKDWPQDTVRSKHYGTAHDWYRQDSGAGNPGMHMGVDAGVGYNNIHWDPTNPMERVSTGQIGGSPLLAKMPGFNDVIPKGSAIYSPGALLGHAADIGETAKVPVIGDWLTKTFKSDHKAKSAHASTEPFYSITEARELTKHGRDWAKWELERKAEWVDKARAAGATARLNAACAALEQLELDARPLAVEEKTPANEAGRAALAKRLDDGTRELFEALANLVRHLHAEAPKHAAKLAGYDNASDWKLPIWPQWELIRGLQDERASHYLPAKP
ncbi:MAG: hypothetical protein M3680_03735 [Myxococcota bacterium]|nr:hypothetical protein [Myxococcota bacterium]